MCTKSRDGLNGSLVRIATQRAAEARRRGRSARSPSKVQPSPTLGDALNAGCVYLAFDPGRASAPCITAPHILPSSNRRPSAPATSDLSWLNPTPHAIAVYASQPLSPVATQHSLPSGRYSLLGPDFHRLDRTSLWLAHLLDQLVGAREQGRRHGEAERLTLCVRPSCPFAASRPAVCYRRTMANGKSGMVSGLAMVGCCLPPVSSLTRVLTNASSKEGPPPGPW